MMTRTAHSATEASLAESYFLGCCFRDQTLVLTAEIDRKDFTQPAFLWIWETMQEQVAQGVKLDDAHFIDLASSFDGEKGSSLMEAVTLCYAPGGLDNVDIWIEQIHEARLARELALMMDEVRAQAQDYQLSSVDITDELTERIERLRVRRPRNEHITGVELVSRARKTWEERERAYREGNPIVGGIPSGIKELDDVIDGFPIGKPSVLAARPAGGKTTALFNFMVRQASVGIPGLYLSNEDTDEPLGTTALAYESQVDRMLIKGGKTNKIQHAEIESAIARALETWAPKWMAVYVHGWSMEKICRRARSLIKRHGFKVVALDYLQNVPSPKDVTKRHEGIEQNLAVWEEMCALDRVAGIVGCQLKRGEGVPTMDRLKDSGAIEQKAKLVLALHENEKLVENNQARVFVLKQNDGVMNTYVDINYRRSTSKFF